MSRHMTGPNRWVDDGPSGCWPRHRGTGGAIEAASANPRHCHVYTRRLDGYAWCTCGRRARLVDLVPQVRDQ